MRARWIWFSLFFSVRSIIAAIVDTILDGDRRKRSEIKDGKYTSRRPQKLHKENLKYRLQERFFLLLRYHVFKSSLPLVKSYVFITQTTFQTTKDQQPRRTQTKERAHTPHSETTSLNTSRPITTMGVWTLRTLCPRPLVCRPLDRW